MTERPVVTERELITWVRRDFGLDLVTCERVAGGTDAAASTWRATTRDRTRLAVRVSTGTTFGVWLAALLSLRGIRGVPMPWRTLDGAVWSTRAGRRVSVASWVSDRPATEGRVTAAHWRALGRLLAQVHGQELTDDLTGLLPRVDHDPTDLAQRTRDLPWTVVRHPAPDDVMSALAAQLAGGLDALVQVADTAERLAERLAGRPADDPAHGALGPAVLCHGDPHLANVLLGGDDVWLVDWDDAVIAPRERDLLLVVGGVLSSWAVTAEQRTWFAEGYGPLDLDGELLHYYACVRAMEDVVGFADRVLDADRFDRAEREEAVAILRGVLSADGIGRLAPDRWAWPPE